MSRNDLALGPKIQVVIGDTVKYRNGGEGVVVVADAQTPGASEATYPIYTQDQSSRAVYAHRADGSMGILGGSPFDIVVEPSEIVVKVKVYRDQHGEVRTVCAINGPPSTPYPAIGEGECHIKL